MKRETQIVIWQFILAFKQKTGEQANYLDLVKKAAYRDDILGKAYALNDPTLKELASKVELGLDEEEGEGEEFEDESESILLAEAPDEAWHEPEADKAATARQLTPTPSMAEEKTQPPAERYAYRLRGALKRTEFSLLHRRALDRFAHKNRLSPETVTDIENRTRETLRMPHLDWTRELQSVLTDLREHHDSLTTLKTQLEHTYVRSGRLNLETFERIYAQPGNAPTQAAAPTSEAPPPQATTKKSNSVWLAAAAVALLAVLVVSLL